MNQETLESNNEQVTDNDSCCSKSSCCGPQTPVINTHPKIGRNDPCPCNSGRKFKKCCG